MATTNGPTARPPCCGHGTGGVRGAARYNSGMARDWQHDALTAYLREHACDAGLRHRGVYLTDPERERMLDDIIAEEYWPQVRDVVRPSRWAVRVDVDGTNPLQAIRTVNGHRHIARELTLLLVDPARWPPQRTRLHNAWHCAGTLRVTDEQEIMFSWRFSLEVPERQVSVASLIPALQEPLLAGMPPSLSYCPARGDRDGNMLPVRAVIAYTPNGLSWDRAAGGTGHTLRIAEELGIPAVNLSPRTPPEHNAAALAAVPDIVRVTILDELPALPR